MSFDDQGVVGLVLPGREAPGLITDMVPPEVAGLCDRLKAYFTARGDLPDGKPFVERAGSTAFTRRIYEVVCSIPRGATMTYAEVAAEAGRPGAARAVGTAMAANRFAPVIPCHRVVGSDGSLRGYGGGLEMKRSLLAVERAR